MLGIDTRAARAAWTVFLVALVLAIIYYIRSVLLLFVLAILFAYILSPVVNLVDRLLPWRRSRNYALAVVYCLLIGLLVLAGIFVGNQVAQQASNLAAGFPKLASGVEQRLEAPGPPWLAPAERYILGQIRERAQSFSTVLVPLVASASGHVLSVLSSMVTIVLIPILAFFFLKDGKELCERLLSLVDPQRRAIWEDVVSDVNRLLGEFIRALVILAFATFCVYGVCFAIARVPYGILLAAIAGALEVIPVFGPFAAAVIIVLVAAFTGYGHVLPILAFIGGYRVFQDYILSPRLMSAGVALDPLLVIFGALAGSQIAGIPGMFLSVPILATLRVILRAHPQVSRRA